MVLQPVVEAQFSMEGCNFFLVLFSGGFCQFGGLLPHPFENDFCEINGEMIGQFLAYALNHWDSVFCHFVDQAFSHRATKTDVLRVGNPVSSLDFVDQVVI